MGKKAINLITFNLSKNVNFKSHQRKKNNVFIGDWCDLQKDYFVERKLKHLDLYDLNNLKKKSRDSKLIMYFYKEILTALSKDLNWFHKKNYSYRSWEIIIGRWLYTIITDIFIRWEMVSKLKKKYEISSFYKLKFVETDFIPESTSNYRMMPREYHQYYSHFIISKIFEFLKIKKNKIVEIKCNRKYLKKELNLSKKEESVYGVFSICLSKNILLYKISFDRKITLSLFKKFIFLNYPLKEKKYSIPKLYNLNLRKNFFERLKKRKTKGSPLKKFLFEQLYYTIPKSFLENFKKIEELSFKMKWPSNPKYILTSYGHYDDEIFKVYCAQKKFRGSRIFIFQHGAGGIYEDGDFFSLRADLNIADRFYSWGKNTKENSRSFFYTKKVLPLKNFRFNKNKKILALLYQLNETVVLPPDGFLSRDKVNRFMFKNFSSINNGLRENLKNKFEVKILADVNSGIKSFERSIKQMNPRTKFISRDFELNNVIKDYNLTISFRVATPFFESLLHNIPTILIFDKKMNINFDKKFINFIKLMLKRKIMFTSTSEVVSFINKNYTNLENWWNDEDLQDLRKKLCDNYCRNFNENNKDFKTFLKSN